MSTRISGTEGYSEEAAVLRNRYEEISFADVHEPVLHLMPEAPCRILDIGSGTGRDAAAFAALGNTVVAVEPVDELRAAARALHPSPLITWLDDGLPDLAVTSARDERFDLIMLTAVWVHLDTEERRRAMPKVAALLHEGGMMMMSLRHGPVPPGRRMFEVSAACSRYLRKKPWSLLRCRAWIVCCAGARTPSRISTDQRASLGRA